MNLLRWLLGDARFGLRVLRQSPGFTTAILAVLSLGIGVTTAMFSLVSSLLLRPLPYEHPEELAVIWSTRPGLASGSVSVPDFLDWKASARTFTGIAAVDYSTFSASGERVAETVSGVSVSADFFSIFGVSALRGRVLGPEDDRDGAPRVAVISAALWQRRFAAEPGIVGKSIVLDGETYAIVGVAPETFRFSGPNGSRCDVWLPLAVALHGYASHPSRGSHWLVVIGRRAAGVSFQQASAELVGIAKSIENAHPDTNTGCSVLVRDLHDELVGDAKDRIWLLFAAVGLVFLAVCANVANLLLARASGRRAEMAARMALGATRGRLLAQMLVETLVIFVVGAIGGAVLSYWLVDLFALRLVGGPGAASIAVHLDARALGFALVTATLCGLFFGLLPALEAVRTQRQAVLKAHGARVSGSRSQRLVRGALVVAQVGLAFVVLVVGGLLLRSFVALTATPVGFEPENVASASLSLPETKYGDSAKMVSFARELAARVASRPGVDAAAITTGLPMGNSTSSGSFEIEGRPALPEALGRLDRNSVSAAYFEAMRIPIVRGRAFGPEDVASGRLVLVLGKSAAERFFPGEDPIGRRIDWGDDPKPAWREVIGIAGDVRRQGLAGPIHLESYVPFEQHPERWVSVVARSARAGSLLDELPGIVGDIDAAQAVDDRRLMTDRVAKTIGAQRFAVELLGAFAAVVLLLAVVGLYGLVAFSTSQRTRELAIRIALGSSPGALVSVVMREAVALLGLGLTLGTLLALAFGRVVTAYVPGPSVDPGVLGGVFLALAFAGGLASLLPALRALRIPPASALREE